MEDAWLRSINTTLSLLDKGLCEFEKALRANHCATPSVLYRLRDDLTAKRREELLRLFAETRELLRAMRERLSFAGDVAILSSMLWAWSWGMRGPVTELEAKHLCAYGELPGEAAKYMQSSAERLEKLLQDMANVAAPGNA